jgi:hypothetical protein
MNKQKVVTVIDRIAIRLSLFGLLGLTGLAGFFNYKYFGLSYLSYLSFFAYIRFLKLFFIPKQTIPTERNIILCFSIAIPGLAPIIQGFPALGFLGFLGFVALLKDKPDTDLIMQENA